MFFYDFFGFGCGILYHGRTRSHGPGFFPHTTLARWRCSGGFGRRHGVKGPPLREADILSYQLGTDQVGGCGYIVAKIEILSSFFKGFVS